jgi:hypothetical protein
LGYCSSNIIQCCQKIQKTSNWFIWRYY